MAISVGSVEVDVIPNTSGIYNRLRGALVPAATRAGEDAGNAAGRAFGPAMSGSVSNAIGERIGQQIGQQIAARISAQVRGSLQQGITQGGAQARGAATRQGNDAGGAFGTMFRRRVQAALAALPDIDVGANTSEADADIRALRVQLETLTSQRIGIDVDAVTARRQIDELERELTRLGAQHPDIAVRANTGAAVAQLAALRAEIDALDGRDVDVRVDPTVRSFGLLVTAAAAFGPAILPILPVVAAGLGAVAAAAVAAGVGLGGVALVAVPALKDIGGALQAQKAAQDAATSSTNRGAGAAVAAQQRAIQMASATQALAAAERNGARQVADAQAQVTKARQNAAQVADQAAQKTQQAARQVRDAERALADAQVASKRAQDELTDARKSAADQLQALNDRLAGSVLDERAAVLRVREAQDELTKARAAGSKATQLDIDRAQLAYDQAVAGLDAQRKENKRLAAETKAANKAGVEGSETVRTAHDRVAEAQQQVADRATAVKDAQANAARVQVQNAQDIAQAQERIGEATRNVAVAQQSAADAVASAQRQITSAQMSAAGGADQAAAAQDKYRQALAKLTPAARSTFNSFVELRSAFTAWSRSLQPQVMPLFTRALDGLRNALPGLTPIVLGAAAAIGRLQDRASQGFQSPWWKSFKADLDASVGPAIEGLGVAFGNVFKGMAGVVGAFLPHMDSISGRMESITQRFANWGANLKGSPAFERFLSYSSEQAPMLAETIGGLVGAFLKLGVALAPMAGTAQSFINALTAGLTAIPTDVLTVIGVTFASIAIGAKLAAAAMAIWRGAVIAAGVVTALLTGETIMLNAAMRANVIGLIVTAIIALVVGLIYAYQNCETFRNIVQGAWEGIKATVSFVWNSILKPIVDGLVVGFKAMADAAVWLWGVLGPIFGFIWKAMKIVATIYAFLLVGPWILGFKLIGAIATWLWSEVLSPVFTWIGEKASWLWNERIKPAWDFIRLGAILVGAKIAELWNTYVRPIFTWIGDKASWLWNKKIKPAWDFIKVGAGLVGTKIKDLWNTYVSPVFNWIGDKAKWLYDKALKPAFDWIKKGIKGVGDSFEDAKDFIGKAWSKVQDIAKKPVRFIIDKIYNAGIVPTWNLIADVFGAPKIKKMETEGWARGGILPGTSSYRNGDDQLVPMRRGEGVYVSEAMRNPYERARLHAVNQAAMRGQSLAPYQGFAKGGIFDWVGNAASKTVDLAKSGISWMKDGIKASAQAGLNKVVKPLLDKISGSASAYRNMVTGIPKKIVKTIVGFGGDADTKLQAAGIGGGGFKSGLKWAKTQHGKPYQWGGNGNPSWDCSGLVSAIESVIRGEKPHRRWATGSFSGKTAPSGWQLGGKSPYMIGITNAGVGHTAGTLNGVNVESRGGDGVVIGSKARSYKDSLFTHRYAYTGKYDSGGYLQPGLNLAYNGTGRPEPVFTTQQANALMGGGTQGGIGDLSLKVWVGSEEISSIARAEIHRANGELIQVLDAGGGLGS
ncbi:hypothetical protein AB0K87_14435 [Streptomyces sp. NPDC053705]|uniref:hypothetical protein n=1 Tax=Streptomyces sp. NPDC053705 TaxID=3156668 RepID=UPI003420A722